MNTSTLEGRPTELQLLIGELEDFDALIQQDEYRLQKLNQWIQVIENAIQTLGGFAEQLKPLVKSIQKDAKGQSTLLEQYIIMRDSIQNLIEISQDLGDGNAIKDEIDTKVYQRK